MREYTVTTEWVCPEESASFQRRHTRRARCAARAREAERKHNEIRMREWGTAEGWTYRVVGVEC